MNQKQHSPEGAPPEPDVIDIEVGHRLRFLRKQRNLTQAALGAALGVSFQQIQKYERAANRISASALVRLARALDVSVSALVGEVAGTPDGDLAARLGEPQALELLNAYARLPEPKLRAAVIRLARSLAGDEA